MYLCLFCSCSATAPTGFVALQRADAHAVVSQLLLQEPQLLLQSWDGVGLLILEGPLQELQQLLAQQQLQHVVVSNDVRQEGLEGAGQALHLLHQLPVRQPQVGEVGQRGRRRAAQQRQALIQTLGPLLLRGQRLLHLQDQRV